MSSFELTALCGPADKPLSHFRAGLLLAAMTLSSIPPALLFAHPGQHHVVRLDLLDAPLLARYYQKPRDALNLSVGRSGQVSIEGVACEGLTDLRQALDLAMVRDPVPEILMSTHPEVDYVYFLEVLAVTKQARVSGLQLVFEQASGISPTIGQGVNAEASRLLRPASSSIFAVPGDLVLPGSSCARSALKRLNKTRTPQPPASA